MREKYTLPPEVDIPGASARIVRQGLAKVFLSMEDKLRLRLVRSADGQILSQIRRQVAALAESLGVCGGERNRLQNDPYAVACTHPKSDLDTVMDDVLSGDSEESFCFLNEGRLREQIRFLRAHFLPENEFRRISYAVKANPKTRILEILSEEGIDGFDCASAGEIRRVLEQNPKADVYFNNPIKPLAHIQEAFQRGVRYYTAQSREEIEKILLSSKVAPEREAMSISVRLITPNEEARINLSEKYGAGEREAREMLRTLASLPRVGRGISIHTGSQNGSSEMFRRGIEHMAEIARQEGGVGSLNIGGGIPVNYHPKDHYDTGEYLHAISDAVRSNIQGALVSSQASDPRIILEPGRAMIAEAVDLAIPILSSETRNGEKCLYINDGVFTSFSDAVVHRWPYYFDVIRRNSRPSIEGLEAYTVFGRTCDSGDTLGKMWLPAGLRAGDHLWVKNAGAYLDSQASHFNGFETPTYVSYNAKL